MDRSTVVGRVVGSSTAIALNSHRRGVLTLGMVLLLLLTADAAAAFEVTTSSIGDVSMGP